MRSGTWIRPLTAALQDEIVQRARDAINVQSTCVVVLPSTSMPQLRSATRNLIDCKMRVATPETAVNELADSLDAEAVRSRTTSLLEESVAR